MGIIKKSILMRMWIKGNPYTLLVRMQIGRVIMHHSMEVPKKLTIELPYNLLMSLLSI
jgi:hypothetical protein